MEKIKLLVVIASLRTGGKEKLLVDILNRLDREQFEPILAVMNAGELLPHLKDIQVYSELARFRGDALGFAWRLWRLIRVQRPQIVYCLSYRIPGWFARLWAKLLGVPLVIYELHGVEKVGERDLDILDRWFFGHLTDHMIAIGEDLRQNFIRDGFPAEKISVIPNGIDTQIYQAAACTALDFPRPLIGCVTKMRPKKNLGLLVDVFARVRQSVPTAHLVIVGDGSERPALEAQIAALNLGESVHLLGLRSDIPALLNCFDVLVLSSTTEAAPLVILEAGACGVPVVSTAVGEIPSLIQDGQTGFLAPSGDAEALAGHIVRLLTDENLNRTMGQQARQHIQTKFSIEASVQAREKLFLHLLGKDHHATS